MTQQQQFAQKVRELIKQSRALSPAARKAVTELLNEARVKILGQLQDVQPGSFTQAQLQSLKFSIERAMSEFGASAANRVNVLQARAFQVGVETVNAPLAAAGLETVSLGQVSRSTLSIAQGYTADLITALSRDSAAKVNAAIQRAFLGGQQVQDIVTQIGTALSKDRGFTGLFSPIGERAASIAQNEVLRVHSIAGQARMEELAERHPDLQKRWKHIPAAQEPRASHVVADGQVVAVDQAFLVDGEELMYPRDPNGSAENTIGCHCLSVPHFDAEALKPTPGQQGLLDKLGISVSVSAA